MSDDDTIRIYDTKAADYAALEANDPHQGPYLAQFIAACPEGGRVLDLGCGPGQSAAVMAEKGLVVDALDASAEMVALAKRHPGITVWQGRFDALQADTVYDGIWANFSLLHAARDDLPEHLQAIRTALKPGGVFHIGMKLGEETRRDKLGRRYTYVTEEELERLLDGAGLTPGYRDFGSGPGLSGEVADWIVMRAHA